MASIDHVTLEVDDVAAAEQFYAAAFPMVDRVRVRPAETPTSGFRGFTLSLLASQPATVDGLLADARAAGANVLKPAEKSLWGYGGVVQAPDGTVWTLASSSKKNTEVAGRIEDVVLQLGVADVAASKQFYADRGFAVAKSYGRRYAELDAGPITLTLNRRAALAKVSGLPAEGAGSHRLVIGTDVCPFVDLDGFAAEAPSAW